MAKSSINFQPVKSSSEAHNLRNQKLDYNRDDLIFRNKSWSEETIQVRQVKIEKLCKELSGRKLQKNATPIREAVINLESHHTIEDLKKLGEILKEEKRIELFQIHIHQDEGRWVDQNDKTYPTKTPEIKPHPEAVWVSNNHAHLIFDWQDKEKGKMLRLNKVDMSQIQTIVAKSLGMERGEKSGVERLEAVEFKVEQRKRELSEVRQELEQSKTLTEEKKQELNSITDVIEQKKKLLESLRKGNRGKRERIESIRSYLREF